MQGNMVCTGQVMHAAHYETTLWHNKGRLLAAFYTNSTGGLHRVVCSLAAFSIYRMPLFSSASSLPSAQRYFSAKFTRNRVLHCQKATFCSRQIVIGPASLRLCTSIPCLSIRLFLHFLSQLVATLLFCFLSYCSFSPCRLSTFLRSYFL
ncbi:hypothetical protein HDK90DRAFT_228039 [Phyllosticta capitalensis]|uniref:Uncharacterized protein n=1 Tax=Phyllosticta capitalensis TaxID=121624 RepID=A0ABR1YU83_9PEZI